jgi:prepilin-type N-terminal cleavage/methylation domain-containing protein
MTAVQKNKDGPVRSRDSLTYMSEKKRRGLTLVEVMVAAGIMASCLAGLLMTYMNLFTLTDFTRDYTLATNAMQARMEEIKRVSFANLSALDGAAFNITGFSAGNATGVSQVTIPPSGTTYTDLAQVRLVVTFKSKGRIIGEDRNLDGVLNASEEANSTGKPDLVTFIANFN